MSESLHENMQEELEIRTDLEAGWQLERRRKIIEDRDELIAFYKERIKAVEEDADWKLGFIDRALRGFFETVQHKATKTQEYYLLPGGKIMMKKQAPDYDKDDKTVIAWLKDNGGADYVKTEEKLDWAALKDASTVVGETIVNSDGEVIPGVKVIEREPKFAVELSKPKKGAREDG